MSGLRRPLVLFVALAAASLAGPNRVRAAAPKVPTDDPYLPLPGLFPDATQPDAVHRLRALRNTVWAGFPANLTQEYFGESPAQRVIFRDSVTGAEVWLLLRTPADERVQYTNYYPFNSKGSLIRVSGVNACVRSDGGGCKPFRALIPHEFFGLPEWSRTDPNIVFCQTTRGALFEYDLARQERHDILIPPPDMPERTEVQLSDDRQYCLFASRQDSRPPLRLILGDGQGRILRHLPVRSTSAKPEDDRMGTAAFVRNQHGVLHIRYSLNKGHPADGPNPYQNYLVDLEGRTWRPLNSQNEALEGEPVQLIPAGTFVVAGHGGYSPSRKYYIHHHSSSGVKWVRDLATWAKRDLVRLPGGDHMDYTVDDGWFFVWARQKGLPIYRVCTDSGTAERIVVTNSCPHAYSTIPYHGASPDGTKLLYTSAMLGNPDLYLAITRYPEPPVNVRVRREGESNLLEWEAPLRHAEIAGYNVYRARQSGGPYVRINRELLRSHTWSDPAPPRGAFYVLTSVEHCGLESRAFSEEAATEWPERVCRYWEAEAGRLTFPMRELFLPNECSAARAIGRAVRTPLWEPATGEGQAEWSVRLPRAGRYWLWVRARSRAGEILRLTVAPADGTAADLLISNRAWEWVRMAGQPWTLPAGSVTIRATLAASGLELDKLLLTSDDGFQPSDLGDTPSTPPEAPTGLRARRHPGGRFVLLNWTPTEATMFHHYQVYRGTRADFTPDATHLIGSPTLSAFIDTDPPATVELFYRVAAVDTWGNASAPSVATSLPPLATEPPLRVGLSLTTATLAGKARLVDAPQAEGGQCVAFGEPSQPIIGGGEIAVTLQLRPGRYFVWLRIKNHPEKPTSFASVHLGDTEYFTNFTLPGFVKDSPWTWRRVVSANLARGGEGGPMVFEVKKPLPTLRIKHHANYLAVDRAWITSLPDDLPEPTAWQFHQGCAEQLPGR